MFFKSEGGVVFGKTEKRDRRSNEGQLFFPIKSRKDNICDFLLLIVWLFCVMKEPGAQP